MSIVKSLVGLHHGEMTVQSTLDVGTTVAIVLPLDLERATAKPPVVTTLVPKQREELEQKVKRSA